MAAGVPMALLLGVVVGRQTHPGAPDLAFDGSAGSLVAQGALEHALGRSLASESQADARVAVQLSFVDRNFGYCRTFNRVAVAGLACQAGGHWQVQSLAVAAVVPADAMRKAVSRLLPETLAAVDRRAAGPTLDAVATPCQGPAMSLWAGPTADVDIMLVLVHTGPREVASCCSS